jgi:hypothetical protein
MVVQGQPWQKIIETLSQSMSQVRWYTLVNPATQEAEVGGSLSETDHECKALSSNLITAKINK